ncbi:type II secretion system F family protein [Streptomyces sp. NRRL B-24484]|uniref:type II secretion system F family protein n=1 Tax=Streptomyces sp. NRRL B-24484 TaxID=1463833 RepID=UPI000D125005|nr:type II secretion system F family protein [Streptomyces sp. NRRL B-24484]
MAGEPAGRRSAAFSTLLRRAAANARRPRGLVPELVLLPIGIAAGHATHSPVPFMAAAVGVLPLRRLRARRRTAEEARRRSAAVIELCTGLVGELRSGATPEYALQAVIGRAPALRDDLGAEPSARLAAARYGADVPAALRLVAELPGGRGAAAVAACWQVSTDSGTGLLEGLDQLADALRAERALAEEVAGELAGSRATVALLAVLPVFGLLLGTALGAHPLPTLLHTPLGLACLAAGAALEAGGLMWTARIVRAAEDAPSVSPDRPVSEDGTPGRRSVCGISRRRADRRDGPERSGLRAPKGEVAR